MRARPAGRLELNAAAPIALVADSLAAVQWNHVAADSHITADAPGGFTCTEAGLYVAEGFLAFGTMTPGDDPGAGYVIIVKDDGSPATIGAAEGLHPGWPVGTDHSPVLILPVNSGGPFNLDVGDTVNMDVGSSVAIEYGTATKAAALGIYWIGHPV